MDERQLEDRLLQVGSVSSGQGGGSPPQVPGLGRRGRPARPPRGSRRVYSPQKAARMAEKAVAKPAKVADRTARRAERVVEHGPSRTPGSGIPPGEVHTMPFPAGSNRNFR